MRRRLFIFLSFLTFAGFPVFALDAPEKKPLLTISGDVPVTNDGARAVFDRAMLKALDWRRVETRTPFTDGVQSFAGPTLASLLRALEIEDGTLRAIALNDYTITIPVSDAFDHDVLLAMEHDGKTMRPRSKGPIWVIYPLAEGEVLADDLSARMIWQLNRIEVQD